MLLFKKIRILIYYLKDEIEPVPEIVRKELLENVDPRPAVTRHSSYLGAKTSLADMRQQRKKTPGCECKLCPGDSKKDSKEYSNSKLQHCFMHNAVLLGGCMPILLALRQQRKKREHA